LTSRVHPGETNSSFILEGILKRIAEKPEILQIYNFFIVPCLNPDGVERGHNRVNMAGLDLN